ncbi:unnamed protein product [Urochloa humidicola]
MAPRRRWPSPACRADHELRQNSIDCEDGSSIEGWLREARATSCHVSWRAIWRQGYSESEGRGDHFLAGRKTTVRNRKAIKREQRLQQRKQRRIEQ